MEGKVISGLVWVFDIADEEKISVDVGDFAPSSASGSSAVVMV